jgi:cell division protease FtsH
MLFFLLNNTDPVHKITIIPRGRAGGYVLPLPDEEVFGRSREYFEDTICAALGGRAAEEIVFNQFTTGASSDLDRVTSMAKAMVTRFGMSETLGPRTFGSGQSAVFLGRDLGEQRDYSEQAAEEIDNEIRRIIDTGYQRAKNTLNENRNTLETLAKILLEKETLDRAEFEELMTAGVAGTGGLPAPVGGD